MWRIVRSQPISLFYTFTRPLQKLSMVFDVDVCGVLWDGEKLWATKRVLYAAKNRIKDIWKRIQNAIGIIYPSDDYSCGMGQLFRFARCITQNHPSIKERHKRRDQLISLIPRDPASILILASKAHFHTGIWKLYDYEKRKDEERARVLHTIEDKEAFLAQVQWKVQN